MISLEADVVIVGAGITGLTTALLLQEAGLQALVLEAHSIGDGATGASTGHLTQVLDVGFRTLHARLGAEVARLFVAGTQRSIERCAALTRDLGIDCGFQRVPGYRFTEHRGDLDRLVAEAEAARDLGLAATVVMPDLPLPWAAGALYVDAQAQLDARRYVVGLARGFRKRGGIVLEGTSCLGVEDGAQPQVRFELGTIRAGHVVLATHTPVGIQLVQNKIAPFRTYVIAATLARGRTLPIGLFWELAQPYHYLCSDAAGARLLVGGMDHRTGQEPDTRVPYHELEAWTRARFDVAEISARWSAEIFAPIDGLPFVGTAHHNGRVLVATGFAGCGLSLGTLAAEVLAEIIEGRPHPLERTLSPQRLRPRPGLPRPPVSELSVRLPPVPGPPPARAGGDVAEVLAGQGRVMEIEGRKLAVYREPGGQLHAFSARCTHLQCLLTWNRAESTWDCPCHGSVFAATGAVLSGPALAPLDHLEVAPHDSDDESSPRPSDADAASAPRP